MQLEAENYCSILVIEPSKIEEDLIWVGTDDGQVHLTKNRGNNWINLTSNIKGLPDGSWITQIKARIRTKGEALLALMITEDSIMKHMHLRL